jgi:hypothetical protein
VLEQGLRQTLGRELDAIVVNGTVPRRFTRDELELISRSGEEEHHEHERVVESATRTAQAVYERARSQQSQIARLRRHHRTHGVTPNIVALPLLFTSELDLHGVREASIALERKL